MEKRTLIMFRHGKAEWDSETGRDFDRPLAARGQQDARKIGRFLGSSGLVPDLIVSSSALRARTTAELAAEAGGWDSQSQFTDVLYNASPATVMNLIHGLPNNADCVLLAGHEPTFSEMVSLLTGGGRVKMATSAMAAVSLPVTTWTETHAGDGELRWLLQVGLLP
ncbi:MAG: SixA phosphatase family protein [bacterium]